MTQHKTCRENHGDPPSEITAGHRRLGMVGGWSAFKGFIDGGGYGQDQSVLDQIASMNATYQEDEYTPRQEAANAIWDSLNSIHTADNNPCPICGETHVNRAGFATWRNSQIQQINTLGSQVDSKWCKLCDDIYALVGQTSYEAYLADE